MMSRRARLAAAVAVIGIGVGGCASRGPAQAGAGSGGLAATAPTTPTASIPAASTSAGHPCPRPITPTTDAHGDVRDVVIDYADVLRFDGRDYQSVDDTPLEPADLGAGVGRVACTLSGLGHVDPGYRMQDGDAAFVPVGTTIYTLKGVPTARELAAEHDGVMHLYRVHS